MRLRYEIAVGIVFLAAMVILGYYTIIMSYDVIRSADSYTISAIFPNTEGLQMTNRVKVNGVICGSVEKIELYEHQVRVVMRMYERFPMYDNYHIAIRMETALGGKGVSIFPGTPFDVNGNERRSVDIRENLIGRMDDMFGSISQILDDNKDNIRIAVQNLREIMEKINSGHGTLGKLVNEDKTLSNADKLVKELRDAIEDSREQAPVTSFIRAALTAF